MKTAKYATRDPEAANNFMNEQYSPNRQRISGTREKFQFLATFAEAGPLRMDYMRHTMTVENHADPFTTLTALHLLNGQLRIADGREEIRMAPGEVCLFPVGVDLISSWSDIAVSLFRLPMEAGQRVAFEMTGLAGKDFRITSFVPRTPALGRYWMGLVTMIGRLTADEPSALDNPLIAADTGEAMARAMLRVFPNTAMTADPTDAPAFVAPAVLRRAVIYLEAHAGRPITVSDIADAAGIGPRALQLGFARYYNVSPMAYLRRIRLERAHQELRHADPSTGTTVASVAAHWGFGTASHFTQMYRQAYGRLPSHTLRS